MTGGSLPTSAILSTQTAFNVHECSQRCTQKPSCLGFNYKQTQTGEKYMNCQLSKQRLEEIDIAKGTKWIFYNVLKVSTKALTASTLFISLNDEHALLGKDRK